MLVVVELRTCRKCGEAKPIDDFYRIRGKHEWTCKVCKIAHATAWRAANRVRARAVQHRSVTKARLGITDEQYDAAWTGQCAVCGATERLCVDHNHKTGVTRGTLCQWCNLAVGWMRDDPVRIRALADYVERDGAPTEAMNP